MANKLPNISKENPNFTAGSLAEIKALETQHLEAMRANQPQFAEDSSRQVYVSGPNKRSFPEKIAITAGSIAITAGLVVGSVVGYRAVAESSAVRDFVQSDDCDGISGVFSNAVSENPCKINVQFPLSLPAVDGETPVEDPFYLQLDTRSKVVWYESDNVMALMVEVNAVPLDSYGQTKASLKTDASQLTAAGVIDGLVVKGLTEECVEVSQTLTGAIHKYATAFSVSEDGFSTLDTTFVDHRTKYAPFTDVPVPEISDQPRREVRFIEDGKYLTCEP